MTISYSKPETLKRAPRTKPTFTLAQLKKSIPPHCFNRSLLHSLSYLFYDISIAMFLYFIVANYIHHLPKSLLVFAWLIYAVLQGCVLTGIWVIGHECGHHAFSEYQLLDDSIGFIIHTLLLVPYFSWKFSHRRHHSNIGSLDKDEVFVPRQKSGLKWFSKYLNNTLGRVVTLSVTLTLGWPLYLAFNASGRDYNKFACHFDPNSPIFRNHERIYIYVSDLGIVAMIFGLYYSACKTSFTWIFCVYISPLLVVNGFLVLITYLQHTHPKLPRYDSTEWDWIKGALSTVDRDYGILNKVFHNITDTHVVHHLFANMPHYHAKEATMAIKPILGGYYRFDNTPIRSAIWRETKNCIYVEENESKGVFWYRKLA
ncbi:hypothetical protein ACFE04_029498 [Oxalis oulophora]